MKSRLTFFECKQLLEDTLNKTWAAEFLLSCDDYLDKKGFLTEKQVQAIKNIQSAKSSNHFHDSGYDYNDEDYEDDYRIGFDPWD